MGSYYLMGTEFMFGMMKKFWRWIVVMVAHLMPLNCTPVVAKMVNFMLCIFDHMDGQLGLGISSKGIGRGMGTIWARAVLMALSDPIAHERLG
jgi:hypothetical protein